MSESLVEQIAAAVLYEGYILYPYRASSVKNRERFTFGRVYPEAYSREQKGAESCLLQCECLARPATPNAALTVRVRFLHAMAREAEDRSSLPWLEAVERSVDVPELALNGPGRILFPFTFPESFVRDGGVHRHQATLEGKVELLVEPLKDGIFLVTLRCHNHTPISPEEMRDTNALLLRTFASAHAILQLREAEFFSPTDPPPEHVEATAACLNIGVWPVLVGDEARAERHTLLASPIILYDYPKIAPESAGDLCDGCEIDEILTLRVRTMTDAEKQEMRGVDEYARRILERTEALPDQDLLKMHGALREVESLGDFFQENTRLERAEVGGVILVAGDRVRIQPRRSADAIDMLLTGKTAVIEAIEQDAEGRIHFALVFDEDPGRDLGLLRQPGHRFFYTADEVEPCPKDS